MGRVDKGGGGGGGSEEGECELNMSELARLSEEETTQQLCELHLPRGEEARDDEDVEVVTKHWRWPLLAFEDLDLVGLLLDHNL